jgi:hypothetical protein
MPAYRKWDKPRDEQHERAVTEGPVSEHRLVNYNRTVDAVPELRSTLPGTDQ